MRQMVWIDLNHWNYCICHQFVLSTPIVKITVLRYPNGYCRAIHWASGVCVHDDGESAERQTQTKAHQEIPKRHSVSNCGIGDNETNTNTQEMKRDIYRERERQYPIRIQFTLCQINECWMNGQIEVRQTLNGQSSTHFLIEFCWISWMSKSKNSIRLEIKNMLSIANN